MAGKNELSETETRLAELESYAKSLENTIFRLESEQKPLQKLALESQKTAKQAIDECNAIKSIAHDDGPVNKLDYNRLRLDHAKTKSQLADTILELDTKKEMLSELQLQLKRDQDVIQNKDRLISNLLADLEQLQSALDIQQMGGTAQPEQTSMASLGRMLGKGRMMDSNEDSKRLEIMTIQLEEAIYEREKFKLMVQQEKDRTTSKAQFTDLPTSDVSSVNDNSTVAPNSDLQSLFHDMNSLIGKEGERYSEQALFNSGTIVLQKVEKLRTKLKSKYSDLNTLKAQLVALSKGFKEKDADLLQQSTHISELEASKSKLQHEILAIEEEHHLELKEMEIEKAKLKSEIQELRDAEALAHKQVLDLKAEFGVKLQDLGDKASMERKKVHQIQAESDLALEQTKKDTNSKINNLLSQITELQGHLSHKSQALSQLSKDAVEQEAKSKEMTAKLEQQVKSLMVQLDQVNLHHNALIQKTADSELQIQSRLKEKDSEISSMGIRVRELESTIQKRDIDHKAIEASLIKATSDYQSLKHELDRLQLDAAAQANKSKDELFEANRKFNSLNRKFKDTQNDAELYKNQCDILEAEVMISKREIKIPTTSADTSPLEMKIKEKDEELTQAHAKIESMLQDLEAKEQELQDLARDGDETLEELERLQNMLFDVKSSRADLLEKLDDYQIEIEELKRQLK